MNDNLELTDNWTGAEGANAEGIPVMVRYRQNLERFTEAGIYQTKIAITWAYDTDEASQMPTPGESEVMDNLEDALIQVLEGDRLAILVSVLTGRGDKTWTWYTNNAEAMEGRLNDVLETFETLPIHTYKTEDPEWDGYFQFITDFGGAA